MSTHTRGGYLQLYPLASCSGTDFDNLIREFNTDSMTTQCLPLVSNESM
jgi:hypothetical protein